LQAWHPARGQLQLDARLDTCSLVALAAAAFEPGDAPPPAGSNRPYRERKE